MGVLTHVMQGWTAADVFGICGVGGRREILVKAWTGPAVSAPQAGGNVGLGTPRGCIAGYVLPGGEKPR